MDTFIKNGIITYRRRRKKKKLCTNPKNVHYPIIFLNKDPKKPKNESHTSCAHLVFELAIITIPIPANTNPPFQSPESLIT
jgi:hypothetical protein